MALVTIHADTSLRQCGAAGAGGWVAREGKRLQVSGPLSDGYTSSLLAELAAIGAVVVHASRRGMIQPGDRLLIINDNANAVGYLRGKIPTKAVGKGRMVDTGEKNKRGKPIRKLVHDRAPKQPIAADLAARVRAEIAAIGATLSEARWTRGHNLKAGGRADYVNHQVDKLAKAGSKIAMRRNDPHYQDSNSAT